MTGDEYMALLEQRRADHHAEHGQPKPGFPALLEWFVRPGDEQLFTPPPTAPQPKRATKPRTYRSAASLRTERDVLAARLARLGRADSDDPATARVGRRQALRQAARMDRELQRYVALHARIQHIEHRIALARSRGDQT